MNDDIREWLAKNDAVCLWSFDLNNGVVSMFRVGGHTFIIRSYTGPDNDNQGWEVYPNLDPNDRLPVPDTLAALDQWVDRANGQLHA